MCGICGAAALGARAEIDARVLGTASVEGALDAMNATLRHRGPDAAGRFLASGIAMAMRRLAVIDVAHGQQPVFNEDRSVVVTCNGEIYNHRELRRRLEAKGHVLRSHSDVEVIPHLYEERGLDFVLDLEGMFAVAVWDSARRRLVLARDRMGIKPLFFARHGDVLTWGSQPRALLAWPGAPAAVDELSLARYLLHEYVPAPGSMLRDVRRLRPGWRLVAELAEARVREEPWWRYELADDAELAALSDDALSELFWTTFRDAVGRELMSDVPLGVFLSGGIDSGAVAAAAIELGGRDVRTFSLGFREGSFDERSHARRVAHALGTRHAERVVDERAAFAEVAGLAEVLDEPLADASIVPTRLLSAFARESVTVAVGGDGADEMLGGYSTLAAHALMRSYEQLPAGVRRTLVEPVVARLPDTGRHASLAFLARRFVRGAGLGVAARHQLWLGAFSPAERDAVLTRDVRAAVSAREGDEPDALVGAAATSGLDDLSHAMLLDVNGYLEGDILAKVDLASMSCSLEVRVPFLNPAVVDLARRIPMARKVRGLRGKAVLRRALRGRLPARTLRRRKHGFAVPVAAWLRTHLAEQLREALAEDRLRRQGLFVPDEVSRLVAEHLSGTHDHRKRLWALLVFQLWHERWIERGAAWGNPEAHDERP